MKPLTAWPADSLSRLTAVLCDIDDTLSWEGRLPAVAYRALERLQEAGLIVVPITGRPAGWCDHIARMWPVDGVVGENGAFYFRYDPSSRKMIRRYWRSDAERREDRAKLQTIEAQVLAEVPGAAVASDQAYREADLAIDFCEDVPALPKDRIARIVEIFEQAGAVAKVSSIHVNGWFGDYDKLTMTARLFREVFSLDIDSDGDTVAFAGDSPNDAPMFAHFTNGVGVANIKDFEDVLEAKPSWVTEAPGGFGFAELADRILDAKAGT